MCGSEELFNTILLKDMKKILCILASNWFGRGTQKRKKMVKLLPSFGCRWVSGALRKTELPILPRWHHRHSCATCLPRPPGLLPRAVRIWSLLGYPQVPTERTCPNDVIIFTSTFQIASRPITLKKKWLSLSIFLGKKCDITKVTFSNFCVVSFMAISRAKWDTYLSKANFSLTS